MFASVLQADRDPGRSHTYRGLKTKVQIKVNDMGISLWDQRKEKRKTNQNEFREIPWNPEVHRNGLLDLSDLNLKIYIAFIIVIKCTYNI